MRHRISSFVRPIGAAFFIALSLTAPHAYALWEPNGTPVNTAPFIQEIPVIVPDGAGGAIIAWDHQGTGAQGWDIYAQRIDAYGVLQWPSGGVPIANNIEDQTEVAIVADGSGGAVLVWVDHTQGFNNFDLYAQRVSSSGTLLWGAGVPISTFIGTQQNPVIVTDDEGGAIIAWEDFRSGNWDIYAQRVSFLGNRVWTNNGTPVVTDASAQADLAIVRDGIGGAIIAWEDFRDGSSGELYAQRLNSAGSGVWGGGIAVTMGANVSSDFGQPVAAGDEQSGVIIAWHEGVTGDLRAQHIDFFGNLLWTIGGVAIGPHIVNGDHAIIADGAGGAIVAWDKQVTFTNNDVFAQRLDFIATKQWGMDGVNASDAPAHQHAPALASDGQNGAIVVWNSYDNTTVNDLHAQRIDASGVREWGPGGQVVSTAEGHQISHAMVSESHAIVAWMDGRNGILDYDIYALRIDATPTGIDATPPLGPLSLLPNVPNPFAGSTVIRIGLREPADVVVEIFDVTGRRVYSEPRPGLPAGSHAIPFSAREAKTLPSGVYVYRVTTTGGSVAGKMVIAR
jgi:hypothetical protein